MYAGDEFYSDDITSGPVDDDDRFFDHSGDRDRDYDPLDDEPEGRE
jgi:hypothetical protein